MTTMQEAAKFEIRNSKLERMEEGGGYLIYFEFRISNFEFRDASDAP
jgi:hypothetical protein